MEIIYHRVLTMLFHQFLVNGRNTGSHKLKHTIDNRYRLDMTKITSLQYQIAGDSALREYIKVSPDVNSINVSKQCVSNVMCKMCQDLMYYQFIVIITYKLVNYNND